MDKIKILQLLAYHIPIKLAILAKELAEGKEYYRKSNGCESNYEDEVNTFIDEVLSEKIITLYIRHWLDEAVEKHDMYMVIDLIKFRFALINCDQKYYVYFRDSVDNYFPKDIAIKYKIKNSMIDWNKNIK